MRRLLSTAIQAENGQPYSLPHPAPHHDILQDLYNHGITLDDGYTEGFRLTDGSFVDREEALLVAIESGQLDSGKTEGFLFSNEVRDWG